MIYTVLDVLPGVLREVRRGVEKHGTWEGHTTQFMVERIRDELDEVQRAIDRYDLAGPHGIKRELEQVAATSLKMLAVLNTRWEG